MKRLLYLIFLVVLPVNPMLAQTTIWEENFNAPKPGWEIEGNWAFESGILIFNYFPIINNYDFSAVSPEIVLTENAPELTVNQFIETYLSSVTSEACEISVIFDGSEEVIWFFQLSEGDWGIEGGEVISFSLAQFAGKTIRIKFRTWGPTTDAWWDWSVYSMKITSVFNRDLSAIDLIGTSNVSPDVTNTWQVQVKNLGLQPQIGFNVGLYSLKTGEELGSQLFIDILEPGDSAFVSFEWTFGSPQNTCLYGKLMSEEDEFQQNNITRSHFLRIEPDFEYQVLLWDNDNGIETIYNPETGALEQPDKAFSDALTCAGINFECVNSLPENLGGYDIIIATLGCYCLS
jgi:hypothetical protein